MMLTPLAQQPRNAVVLMVEDNDDHAFLARESFDEARLRVELHHVTTGVKCMQFLRREAPYQNMPRPDLVLLDIHMPLMDGYEVMEAIAADPALKGLTVIVLTTSAEHVDVNRMYGLGCKSYMTKPVDFQTFTDNVRKLAGYWLDLVILPGR